MIVDSHAYCFTAPDTPAGHESAAAHLEFWQRQQALHHQPAYRVRDRARGDSRVLLDPTPEDPLRLSEKRHFRVDRVSNRFIWTVDGEDYTKQQLPPNVIEFSPGALIAEMDYADVDWALLHTDATLSKDMAHLAACIRAYPHRLRAMGLVDEWQIPHHPDVAIAQAVDSISRHGLHALKIIPEYAYRMSGSRSFNDPSWRPFWEAVIPLQVPFFFTLGARPDATDPRQGFVDELWELRRWMDRYPGAAVSVTHGYPWRDFLEENRFVLPASMWEPFIDSSLCIELGFPFRIGDLFDYPYFECRPVIEAMMRHLGPDRLMWGTDMPFQNRFCTYRQSRDYLEKHCRDLLSPADLAKIMGGTAARMLRL
ncbi:MAG: amidohydrolase family protein [Opitutaceae bacterium]|nr:amidohydrolase family protein [Opitutaceae bacterium]